MYRAGRAIPPKHKRPRIVAEDRRRDPAEVDERCGDALAPIVLALIEKRFNEESAGLTEDGDEQEDANGGPGDDHALLAEIDLQLCARRRFHAHRRDVGGALRLPHGCNRALYGAQPDDPSLLAQQPMHHDGIPLGDTRIERLGLAHHVCS
jgi:hypothetical protein